jgi:hypothetical protein
MMVAQKWHQDRQRQGEAKHDGHENERCLRISSFGGMGGTADGPYDEHNQVHHRDGQDDKGKDPISNRNRPIFVAVHNVICCWLAWFNDGTMGFPIVRHNRKTKAGF